MKNFKKYLTKAEEILEKHLINKLSLILSIVSLIITILVRNDTAELAKFNDKPVYYDIKLYTNEQTYSEPSLATDKYISLSLDVLVDDFKVVKKNFLDINYNAVFTKVKYFTVYDYDENENFQYMRYRLDDRSSAKTRLEEQFIITPTKFHYAITPNQNYCYMLIYTETTSQKNLDLIFFEYPEAKNNYRLDTFIENGIETVNINRIDSDTNICKDYFKEIWSERDTSKEEDIDFMFRVYQDLTTKLNNVL